VAIVTDAHRFVGSELPVTECGIPRAQSSGLCDGFDATTAGKL